MRQPSNIDPCERASGAETRVFRRFRKECASLARLLALLLLFSGCETVPAGRTVVATSDPSVGVQAMDPSDSAGASDLPNASKDAKASSPARTAESKQGEASSDAKPADGPQAEAPKDSSTGTAQKTQTESKPSEAEAKEKKRKARRRVLLKTAYDDREVGEEQTPLIEAELGLFHDEALERYVQSIAVRLLRYAPRQPFEYEFKIVDQEVPNAFALPGGKIYVSRGLLALANSEDELAAVIGHEITHAAERHAAARIEHSRRINPLSVGFMRAATIAAYGRDQERDADRGGQILAARAGYDPNGIATFLRKLDATERYEVGWSRLPNFLATHPTSPQRSALAAQRASELEWKRAPGVAAEMGQTYHDRIDGMPIGKDPAGGLFKDGRFVHPDLSLSLRFPPGWKTLNSPQAVSAISPARDAEASLTAAGAAGDLDQVIKEFLEEDEDGDTLRVLDRRPIIIGEIKGTRIEGRASGFHVSAAFIEYEGIVFRLMFLTVAGGEGKYRGRANAFIQSFRPLEEADRYSLAITRIRIAFALANETLEQLSKRTGNALELVYTGLLNDVFASTELRKAQPIKIGLSEPYFPKPREETRKGKASAQELSDAPGPSIAEED